MEFYSYIEMWIITIYPLPVLREQDLKMSDVLLTGIIINAALYAG